MPKIIWWKATKQNLIVERISFNNEQDANKFSAQARSKGHKVYASNGSVTTSIPIAEVRKIFDALGLVWNEFESFKAA